VNAKEIDRELNTGRPTAHATTESGSKRTRAAELHNLSEKVVSRFPVVNSFPLSFAPLFCSSRPVFSAAHCLLA